MWTWTHDPGRDRLRGEPDDLPVLPDRLPDGQFDQRDLVPQRDRLAGHDRPTAHAQREPRRDRPGGDRHVVVAPEQDRPPIVDRRRRHGWPLPTGPNVPRSPQSSARPAF